MVDAKEPPAGVRLVRAPNPSPMTLDGTNSWVVEGWVVDPGPAIRSHIEAIGPVEGVVLTHSHTDHSESAESFGVPVHHGSAGPFTAIPTPGHSADSICLLYGRVLFSGDTVLGRGSVFVAPGDGSLSAYLASLERLLELDLEAICPGHGPVVWAPRAKLQEYIDHRLEREGLVLEALAGGARTVDELLDSAWADVDFSPAPILRLAAGASLAAHLEKLAEEGRLPDDVSGEALHGPGLSG